MPENDGIGTWKKKRRQEHLELRTSRYYIFCEGERTEPQYFGGFRDLIEDNPVYRDMIRIEPCGADTMHLIRQAEKYAAENHITKGQIWCVYDKDSFRPRDFNGVVRRAEALNKQTPDLQYHAAWSNECIEFWFLLHFAYYTSNNYRRDYIRFLNERFADLGFRRYRKNMKETFSILMMYGDPKLAARYARRILKDHEGMSPADIAPGTTVYQLVEELAKYLPEEARGRFIAT